MKNWKLQENATKTERLALQRLCREQLKIKLLADIRMDIEVCRLEGWGYKDYIKELIEILSKWI